VLWWALALGADLGGNATAVGAEANVVILGLAERAGRKISFWDFTRYGLIVAAITVALCAPRGLHHRGIGVAAIEVGIICQAAAGGAAATMSQAADR
jgi:hypothetical protein